jgi:hypothetical protein
MTGGQVAGLVVGVVVGTATFSAGFYALGALILAGRCGGGSGRQDDEDYQRLA